MACKNSSMGVACLLASVMLFMGSYGAVHQHPHEMSFRDLGIMLDTDKVTAHNYHNLYEKYLQPLRHRPIRLLEIGLGCDMAYGPGHSLALWTQFFSHKNSSISFVEFDRVCAEKYRSKIEAKGRGKVYVGDQAEDAFLQSIVAAETASPFDIIIDDGALEYYPIYYVPSLSRPIVSACQMSCLNRQVCNAGGHTMVQQTKSLLGLWSLVNSGGYYVVEDLSTSYVAVTGGGAQGSPGTMIGLIKDLIDGLNARHCYTLAQEPCANPLSQLISFECFEKACIFIKRSAEQ